MQVKYGDCHGLLQAMKVADSFVIIQKHFRVLALNKGSLVQVQHLFLFWLAMSPVTVDFPDHKIFCSGWELKLPLLMRRLSQTKQDKLQDFVDIFEEAE